MSQQPVINPTNTTGDTLIDTVMEEATASSSSHVLSHSEIDLTSRDPQEKDIHTQTPITENFPIMDEDPSTSNPDKGKSAESQPASQTNKPNSIEISVLNDIFKQTPQASNKAHKGFIPRDSFRPELSNNDIIKLLKTSFICDSNAFKFEVNSTSTYKYFTIYFRTRDSLNQYIEKCPPELEQVKIFELTNTAINTLLERKFSNLDQAVIKIMDIPYNYDTSMLIKHLAIKTNSIIIDHKEIKKPPRKIPNRNNRGRPIYIKPAYKQLIIRFDKQTAYDYFMQENYWSLEIENFVVRILPGNQNDPEFKKRTGNYFKITGLPLNSTAMDLEPLIKHIYGRTCTFTQTTRYSTAKNAYIYVSPDNYPTTAMNGASSLFEGHNIYILPGHLSVKTCNTCGSPLHLSNNCDDKNFKMNSDNRKIFQKRFIDRKDEKITINECHKNRYNHVISLNTQNKNANLPPKDDTRTQPQTRTHKNGSQSGSLLYPRQGKQPRHIPRNNNETHNWDDLLITPQHNQSQTASNNHLNKRIDDLEKQVQSLINNIRLLQQNNTKTDQSIADLHHSHMTMDTSLSEIKERCVKYDTIIQQLTTNINLLSKKEIAATQERPRKISKKVTPYEQTSYRATKSKYNLRNNKDNTTYEDESEFHPSTGDDTDVPDENAMSDGASFEGIIDNTLQEPVKNDTFTVKSYNPLNLLNSFNATR
ncbi:uncharacterized protein OCT59_000193 [Rhizophagus irregularis]|uniref:CCHC-type domain-containing protein n=2 Tax=Rhizophagus irregularis TaxID=588596 RepID=A0A015JEW3_RHIIW|nr:hypothetical protein GLOIN_2v1774316 [Rhizophagus irregularis DAOM 181602=DAOM 197198]EXX68032.1 hypothetical protein RirG_108820 [Rhizophagus irregularis DAOM 197198w]POG71930.1 hypothetical protein GLOIN_2v1774316 [Rhizophagus irregularis DAOM 181602=DAOM 197198]UZN98908.1 hypothetical protein OCT59_000193 [Rhizophagus irregularis]GBC49742.1 hypothetical protein GLOIN_2v1774316 [Rhizophagus irregularis DAOM 181602=DAOM 197198]|eukprot:XP_025178796.1 hypothetical protein GLOIN_2v1774316 [Rhizophagus irregularis DAOM 181602=DAOM 197198]